MGTLKKHTACAGKMQSKLALFPSQKHLIASFGGPPNLVGYPAFLTIKHRRNERIKE
jgi:hypothetical protein